MTYASLHRSIRTLALLAPIVALTACQGAEAEAVAEDPAAQNEVLAQRYVDAYNAQDLDALAATLTDPIAFNGTDYERDTLLGFVDAYWSSFPDIHLTPTHNVGAAEHATVRVEFAATGHGEYMEHDVDGREVEATEIMLFRVRDGRIAEYWSNWDELGFLSQLGIVDRP